MGLAIQTERPRNWITKTSAMSQAVNDTVNAQFLPVGGFTLLSAGLLTQSFRLPYNAVVHRFWIVMNSNSLDVASVNTITLQINSVDVAGGVITLTDTSPSGTLLQASGLTGTALAGQVIALRWNSDSTGTCFLRQTGIAYRLVNPSA